MTNYEWLLKENAEVVKQCLAGCNTVAVNQNGSITRCHDMNCNDCIFNNFGLCDILRKEEWLKAEHNPYTIPLDTPIDTKVLVSHSGEYWYNRYFAGFSEDEKEPYFAFEHGATSWSSDGSETIAWKYCKLVEEN